MTRRPRALEPPIEPDEPDEPVKPDEPSRSEAPRARLSYRERREQSDALAALARSLVELRPSQLAEVSLPDELRQEIERCRGFRKGARIRQLRRISQLLRREDVEAVRGAAADAGHKQRRRAERERIYEHWRERLLAEGDRAVAELVARYPRVEAQRLRQRLRGARRDPESARARQARREILRMIRDAAQGEPPPGSDPSPSPE